MWEVANHTPFSAEGYFVRDRRGAEHWVVAVRATFDIRGDVPLGIAEEQKPVLLAPDYADDGALELRCDSDISPFKPKTDFIVRGNACLPDMRATEILQASVVLGEMRRTATVSGPRRVTKRQNRLEVERGGTFETMDLSWRNSLGGEDAMPQGEQDEKHDGNPLGLGWTRRWPDLPDGAQILLPFIEDAADRITLDAPLPQPFGLGAVQPHWRPRRDHAGTYDDPWKKNRAPLPPDDFDERFHNFAPTAQQQSLLGGESVSAVNLNPDGVFSFRLPQLILEARTRIGGETHDNRFRLVTVELDTTAKKLAMVWNASVNCNGRDMQVENSSVRVKQMAGVTP